MFPHSNMRKAREIFFYFLLVFRIDLRCSDAGAIGNLFVFGGKILKIERVPKEHSIPYLVAPCYIYICFSVDSMM